MTARIGLHGQSLERHTIACVRLYRSTNHQLLLVKTATTLIVIACFFLLSQQMIAASEVAQGVEIGPASNYPLEPPFFDLDAHSEQRVSNSMIPVSHTASHAHHDHTPHDQAWHFQFLPSSLIYKSYLAGVKESRVSMHHVGGTSDVVEKNFLSEATLGTRIGIFRYGTGGHWLPQGWQVDVEASAQVRLNYDHNCDVDATDYRAGIPLTYGIGKSQLKFAYYHLSSHLGDEFMLRNPHFLRLNYSRDALVFGFAHNFHPNLRLYAEAGWSFYSDVCKPWEFQFGMDYAPGAPTGLHGAPFVAINGHLREEVNFGGNLVFQTGWAWRSVHDARLLRAGLHYYNGESNQFSLFDFTEHHIGVGVWYDF